jgi:hypothetical protein
MKQQADSEIQTLEQPAGRPRVNPRVARDRVISANNEPWAVEPPKTATSKKRKALRIALIVAAVGAVAAAAAAVGVAVLFGGRKNKADVLPVFKTDFPPDRIGGDMRGPIKTGGEE